MRVIPRCLWSAFLALFTLIVSTAAAQSDDLLYVIYDSSNSMWGELADGSRKYEAGRKGLDSALGSSALRRDLAFRAYGHREVGDCRDSELIVPPMPAGDAAPLIAAAVQDIRPTGKTPISYSLREALKDFDERRGDILLISDGLETCDADPCALMYDWREQDVKVRVHVVGVGLNDIERKAMMCVAEAGGGQYFDAGSESEFRAALDEASAIEPGAPAPIDTGRGYALILSGADESGRSFLVEGQLFRDGAAVGTVTSNGRNVLDGPGEYDLEVGAVLRDGTLYKPVRQTVVVDSSGETRVSVTVTRPAIVSASFSESGDAVRGASVSAWQDGREVFRFRAFDEVLARPGAYEFRSSPNADNELVVAETLTEGEHSVIDFVLVNTVGVRFQYVLPNGEADQRTGELYIDDELRYSVSGSRFNTVLPGTYELRDKFDDPMNQLDPIEVTITTEEEQVIDVPMTVGYIATAYSGEARDYHNQTTTRVFIHAVDPETGKSTGSITSATNRVEVAKPGLYRVAGHSSGGYFDPVDITVEANERVTAELIAKATADVSVSYPPDNYEREPDRAFLIPLDGQNPKQTYMRPGAVLKVPPGRYRVDPHGVPGTQPLHIELEPGEVRSAMFEKPDE